MFKRYLFSILALIVMTVSAHATDTYYCDTGDDTTGDGSIGNPWASWDKATATLNSGSAGDGVYLCRGGSFSPSSPTTLAIDCTSDNVCNFGAYGTGDRPEITGGGLGLDNAAYINIGDLSFAGTWTSGSGGSGATLTAENQHITFDNIKFEGLYLGINILGSKVVDRKQTYITIKNSQFINNSGFGLIGGSTYGKVYNNTFDRNGVDAFTRAQYVGGANSTNGNDPDYMQYQVISGNTYINNAPGNIGNGDYAGSWSSGTYGCVSTVVGGHGITTGTMIKNNIIREEKDTVTGGCWGFAIDTAWNETDEHAIDLVFQNNENYYAGNMLFGCSNCSGVIFRENIGYNVNGNYGILAANRTEDTPHPTESMNAFYNLIVFDRLNTGSYAGGIGGQPDVAASVVSDIQWNVIIFSDASGFNRCTLTNSGSTVQNNFCFGIDGSGDFTVNTNYVTN